MDIIMGEYRQVLVQLQRMNLVLDCVSSYVIDGKRERELRDAKSASRRKRSGLVGTKQLLKAKELAGGTRTARWAHFGKNQVPFRDI